MGRPTKYPDAFYRKHLPTALEMPDISISIIAQKLGMSPAGVTKVIKRLGLPMPSEVRRRKKLETAQKRKALPIRPNYKTYLWDGRMPEFKKMLDDGESLTDIAYHYDTTYAVVFRWRKIFEARGWEPLAKPASKFEYPTPATPAAPSTPATPSTTSTTSTTSTLSLDDLFG